MAANVSNPAFITRLIAAGGYLPERAVSNAELSETVDTSDEWISSRSGIRQRYFASEKETTSYMAARAAEDALSRAGVKADKVGLIIVATTTPDYVFPAVAVRVQREIGARNAAAFDVQAVCGGFVYGLATADGLLKNASCDADAPYALVIGADRLSAILDMTDRGTCVLFGDGAGAALLKADTAPEGALAAKRGIVGTYLRSDGSLHDILYAEGGAAAETQGPLKMEGKDVFRHAAARMAGAVSALLEAHGLSSRHIDHLVPHQANIRIMEKAASLLEIQNANVFSYVDRHANTSAASVPLALAAAHAENRLSPGDLLALTALGGGLAWGAGLVYWG